MTPEIRVRAANRAAVREDGDFVLYWMTAYRRLEWNFALEHAVERALEYDRPLVILEALRSDYRWASPRTHRFVLDGMAEHAEAAPADRVLYWPYVEPEPGAGRGLLEALAEHACLVVGDDAPVFFLPRMVRAAAQKLRVRLELVDANGLMPLAVAGRDFATAYAFRRHLQKELPHHLEASPKARPLNSKKLRRPPRLPRDIAGRWPRAPKRLLGGDPAALAELPLDEAVGVVERSGGTAAARRQVKRFVDERLERYAEDGGRIEAEATSELSPYLHFGQISSHEIFDRIARREDWSPDDLADEAKGKRAGWWGMSESAEAFLDQLVTWREVGYHTARWREDCDDYATLPEWARETLAEHASDRREPVYEHADFEGAATHDELWNAAQRQLRRDGVIHNYTRMLWGKKILEWSESPERALEVMLALNDRWAVDGRDPNSVSGIFWVLGRYDRAWGPEREVFGKIRYMSSDNTARKMPVSGYLERYGPAEVDA